MLSVLTALITPFDTTGSVDYISLEKIIQFQIDSGCGIVLFGTTGECPTLNKEEKKLILELVKNKYPNNLNDFVIGVGGNNTLDCITNITEAVNYGFEIFMITCPYYNKPSQKGLEEHFNSICNIFPSYSFIIYNIPGRTSVNLLPQTFKNICDNNLNIVGIKEASGDLNQMILVKKLCPKILLYSGDDILLIPTLSIDGFGVVSVISNLFPKEVNSIVELYKTYNQDKAFNEYLKFDELIRLMFIETNPVPIKFIMCSVGLIQTPEVRLPLVQMDLSNKNKILNWYNNNIIN